MLRISPRIQRRLSALAVALLLLPGLALAQQSVVQGGATTQAHVPAYASGGTGQPIVIDSGPAGGNTTGQGASEFNITARGTGTAPYAAQGTGVDGTIFQIQDAVSTNATGYHYLSFSANALGGGLIEYGAAGSASALPFVFKVNGTSYSFPFVTGGIVGPGTTVVNDLVCWNNLVGTLVKDCGTPVSVGGSSGQVQYNNSGALGGFTVGGDGALNTGTGALTISKIGGQNISLAGSLTTGGAFTTAGANALTLTTTTTTNVTMPAAGTGTLSTLAGAEAFTNKTYNGNTWTAGTGTLTIGAGKTLTASNTLTFAGTDSSTLNIGGGGTLGSAAFTATSAYMASGTQITNSLSGDVTLNNTANYFDGPSVAQGSTGTWFCSGTATVTDSSGGATFNAKLWDGTTVIASAQLVQAGASTLPQAVALSGYLATPAGNIRISVKDSTNTAGAIKFNATGNSKDSTLSCFRVQ